MASPLALPSLPDDLQLLVLDCLSSWHLLQLCTHDAPAREWSKLIECVPVVDLDLERDVAEQMAAAKGGSSSTVGSGSSSLDVSRILSRRRGEYTQLLRLVHLHARNLQSLSLDRFGPVLEDEIPPASDSADPIRVQSLLGRHAHSLMTLSIVGSNLRALELGEQFRVLESVDLSKSRSLSDLRITAPSLTALDLSRTLVSDFDLLKLLPSLRRLRVLRLLSCKNIRVPHGDNPEELWGRTLSSLRILDLSNTRVVDVSVGAISRHSRSLHALFISDCRELRSPSIVSSSLRTLSLRGCNRITSASPPRIDCPNLRQLDLGNVNVRDGMISGGGLNVPRIEVLMLNSCVDLTAPRWQIQQSEAPELDLSLEELEEDEAEESIPLSSSFSSAPSRSATTSSSSSGSKDKNAPLAQVYANLHTLDLSSCFSLTNPALQQLLHMAPNLTFLDLSHCRALRPSWREAGEDESTPEHVDLFPPSLARLREVALRGCNFTDENLASLFASSSTHSLQSLSLRSCASISGAGIRAPQLLDLDLRSTALSEESLLAILAPDSCPSLLRLDIGQCDKLVSVHMAHASLQELSVSHCVNLRSLRVDAPNLHRLDASMNFSLTMLDLRACPALAPHNVNLQHSALVHMSATTESAAGAAASGGDAAPAVQGVVLLAPFSAQRPAELQPALWTDSQAQKAALESAASHASVAFSLDEDEQQQQQQQSATTSAHVAGSSPPRGLAPNPLSSARLNTSSPLQSSRSLIGGGGGGASGSSSRRGSVHAEQSQWVAHGLDDAAPVQTGLTNARAPHHGRTLPSSPQRKPLAAPLSPSKPVAAGMAALSLDSTGASSSSTIPNANNAARPLRALTSSDVCISEERVRALESKLKAEQAQLSLLQRALTTGTSIDLSLSSSRSVAAEKDATSSSSAVSPSASAAAVSEEAKRLAVVCYGLRKQLAVARAKLKKEQKQLAEQQRHEEKQEEEEEEGGKEEQEQSNEA